MDFDDVLLPEDSWEGGLADKKFEVDRIADVQSGRKPRVGRVNRQVGKHYKCSSDPSWINEADLNCVDLLQECDRDLASRNRFEVRQSYEAGLRVEHRSGG